MNNYREKLKEYGIEISEKEEKKLISYRELIKEWNERINLTAILSDEEFFYKHFLDSILLKKYINIDGLSIIDIGTGAGFPGVPLSITANPKEVVLTDSLKKRTDFLNLVISDLELNNVSTLTGRFEELGKDSEIREKYDIVTARAVAKLPVLLEYAVPFIKQDGLFVSYKGPDYVNELENAKNAIAELDVELLKVEEIEIKDIDSKRYILIFRKKALTKSKYPRRVGIPSKRPL